MALRVVKETQIRLKTSDGVPLNARLWQGNRRHGRLWIVAPGFAKHGGSPGIRLVVNSLLAYGDVMALDFRGTGASGGRYGFGAYEYRDLRAAWAWAGRRWKRKRLLGLSMGGYHCTRFAAERPKGLEAVHVVSGPSKIEHVVMTGGPVTQCIQYALSPHRIAQRLSSGITPFFRWGWPFFRKPDGADLARQIQAPAHFLVGTFDWLVFPFLTRRIHRGVPGAKTWTVIPWGYHAEYMAMFDRDKFDAWLGMTVSLHLKARR